MLDSALELLYFILVCISVVVMAYPIVVAQEKWDEYTGLINELRDMDLDLKGLDYDNA
tara:strand:- start:239 stop:412 length:174 start_codon:yes stop_codon:yes gene_type:complete